MIRVDIARSFPLLLTMDLLSFNPHTARLSRELCHGKGAKNEVTRDAKKEKLIFVRIVGISELLSGFLGDLSTGDSQREAGSVTHKD